MRARPSGLLLVAALGIASGCGGDDEEPGAPTGAGYNQRQAKIAIGSGQRAANDPRRAAAAAPVGDLMQSRSHDATTLLRSLDHDDRWMVRRAVARRGGVLWVYTGLPSTAPGKATLIEICDALHQRLPWTRSVSVIDARRTTEVASRTKAATCAVAIAFATETHTDTVTTRR